MGCLCSKSTNEVGNSQKSSSKHGQNRETEVSNILHQSISLKNSVHALASLAELFITNPYEAFSLYHCPPSDELLQRCWIYKRGHLVRTWKKRYCVLDKNDLNYYVKSAPDPPYGKKRKGKVAMLGAVCIDRESDDGKNIEVEIYGNVGEKDLFFSVTNNEEGQTFVRTLQWAIRKTTLTVLTRSLKTSAVGKRDKNSEKYLCTQWKENQNLLFTASIHKLLPPQLVYILLTEPSGQIKIKPCVMKLWNIFGDAFIPTIQTDSAHMGIAYHTIFPSDLEQYNGTGLPFFKEQQRILSFDDIIEMTFQYVDEHSNNWLQKNINHLHHHGNIGNKHKNKSKSQSGKGTLPSSESSHENHVYMLVTLWSKYDYKLHILACCLHDYHDSLLAIQHILLFLNLRSRLHQLYHQSDTTIEEIRQSRGKATASVSLAGANIKLCSAAQALSLVSD